ncbi:hypothetical protein O7605_27460 [Verrucosispora sp. WMMA2121]|uniref:hypothetical protein n=1 Tax=Verrucosispora sp. WMMA2121 TaxID=3015164 RepID=UPI0022B691FF|nr:hypothetical protein [Verrucosispora sp. WMMA2121]MCZ7423249.1 hypothetical protein [Verrucosispora sp. WMMA2121]
MSGPLAQVIAQLRSAVDQLDGLAVQATRAATDVAGANTRYAMAGKGSDHPTLRAAVSHSRNGVDKAHRLARLSSEAARNVTAYLNAIAPGSMPQATTAPSGPPSGEDLVSDSDRRDLDRAKLRGFINRPARRADDVQDHVTTAADTIEKSISVLRDRSGPHGTHSTGTATPTVSPGPARPKIDAAEAAGNIAVLGILLGVAVHRTATVIGERLVRFRRRGRKPVDRPDSGSGQG